ncbi:MAG: chromate efflux transporter [Pseudomonadota bacterium]|nr:chromate efflux transporter [Pseudomonadota bacterium]
MSVPLPQIPLHQLLGYWFRLGWISFGGPAGQIALLHDELVTRRQYLPESKFLYALNFCMLLPGPEAQQLATYTGYLLHGRWGGIVAGMLFILPSLFILMGLAWLYLVFGQTVLLAGLLYGIKPAITAIVLQAAWRIGTRTLTTPLLKLIAGFALLGSVFHLAFPMLIGFAALVGWLASRVAPQQLALQPPQTPQAIASTTTQQPIPPTSLAPTPAKLWRNSAVVILIGLLLWALPMLGLVAWLGLAHPLIQMGWFFTTAALLTFGGAYAVLPYVYQGAVLHYQWLEPKQMIDGLALGESTPGPLIMVVVFVAFVASYQNLMLGTDQALLAGIVAALVVTWVSFLPSFIFILAGAPLIERTQHLPNWSAPLKGITAAVVGVIVNLALFFALHTLWPSFEQNGFDSVFDAWSLGLMGLAAWLLFWRQWSVLRVLGLSACIGLVVYAVRGSGLGG